MNARYFIIPILLFLARETFSQGRENIWCFGDSALLDFNSGAPLPYSSGIHTRGTACSIADANGNLLFYSGSPLLSIYNSPYSQWGVVYNKNHQVMDSGDSLHGEMWYNEMIIVPDPGDSLRYYLFHMQESITFVATGLFYSIVDLHYNNGLGKVVSKNNQILSSTMSDCLSAVKHGDGRDWWVICRKSNAWTGGAGDTNYYKFLVTPSGILNFGFQTIGTINQTNADQIRFNRSGNKMIYVNLMGLVELYDFDRCTGLLSNPVTIDNYSSPYPSTFSAEFSASGNRLYVATCDNPSFLYQYDLTAANIHASKQAIYAFSTIGGAFGQGGALKRGPNQLIYWTICYRNMYPYPDTVYNMNNNNLSVVTKPEALGLACDFQPFSVPLGTGRTYWGLPNNPDYDLPAFGGSVCDTLGLWNEIVKTEKESMMIVYPNPALGKVTISTPFKNSTIRICDMQGRMMLEQKIMTGSTSISLPPGVYFVNLYTENGNSEIRKIVVL